MPRMNIIIFKNASRFFNAIKEPIVLKFSSYQFILRKIGFYTRAIVNRKERNEILLFRKLCSLSRKSKLSDIEQACFISTVKKVNHLFTDEIIKTHNVRLHNSIENWKRFQERPENEEKKLIRLHEFSEILSLKWHFGRGFDKPAMQDFLEAHNVAVQVENTHMIVKAKELGLILTTKALQYMRLCDEILLNHITSIQNEIKIDEAVEVLTRNQNNRPSLEEMEAYVKFMDVSGVQFHIGRESVYNMVWSRYMFSALYGGFEMDRNRIKVLLLLIHFSTKKHIFMNYHPNKVLKALAAVLKELTTHRCGIIADSMFNAIESIERGEKGGIWLQQLTDRFQILLQ